MGTSQGIWRPSPAPIPEPVDRLSAPGTSVSARSASAATAWSEPDDVNQLSTHSWGNSRPPSRAIVSAPARNESEERELMAASQSSWVSRVPPTSAQRVDQALVTDCSVWRDMPPLPPIATPSRGSDDGASLGVSDAAWSRSPEFTEYTTQQDQEWVSAERRAAIESSLQENTPAKHEAQVEVSAWGSPNADPGAKNFDTAIRPGTADSIWSESPEIATEWENTDKLGDVGDDPFLDIQSHPALPRSETLLIEADSSPEQRRPSFLNAAFDVSQESFGHFSLASPPARFIDQDPSSPTIMREESFDGPSPPPRFRPPRNPAGEQSLRQLMSRSPSPQDNVMSRSPSPQEQDANPFSLSKPFSYNMPLMPVRIPPLPEPLLRPSARDTDFTSAYPVTEAKRRRVNSDSDHRSASPLDRSARSGLSASIWSHQADSQWDEFSMMSGRLPPARPSPTNLIAAQKMAPLRTHPALAVDMEAGNLGYNVPPPNAGDISHQAPVPGVPGFFNLPNIADTAISHQWGVSPLLDLPPISDPGDTTARSWAQSVEADIWE